MDVYIWANQEQYSLRKIHNPDKSKSKVAIICEKKKKDFFFYGVYNAHDNYMGFPYGEALTRLIHLLKEYKISYDFVENPIFSSGEFYTQTNCYIILDKKSYLKLKKSRII